MMNLQKEALERSRFLTYRASSKLRVLAETPDDLTEEGKIDEKRLRKFSTSQCGLQVLYATQRVDDQVMSALQELADESEAVKKMARQQNGEVMNKIEGFSSDERRVLHTAIRDFFGDPNESPPVREAAALARQECEKLRLFEKEIGEAFTDLVMIGIGGSNLGPEALYKGLEVHLKGGRRVHFISNIDPDNLAHIFQDLDLETTLVGVVSKSGTTIETVTNEKMARQLFEEAELDPKEHFLAITAKGSPMEDPSRYRHCFAIWDYVGGRFSGTAMPGGVIFTFAFGFDVYWEFLRGCNAIDKNALNEKIDKNLPLLLAVLGIWNHNFLKMPTCCVVPYSYALRRFAAHIQQVDMESNGKHIDTHGYQLGFETSPVIFGEPGTNAQHSFFQMVHQGTQIVPLELIGFRQPQHSVDMTVDGTTSHDKLLSNLIAQALALATGRGDDNPNKVFKGNRPSLLIMADRLTPFVMGALYALYEHKVAFQGYIWDINSFDQEGVMLGKELANDLLGCFAARRGHPGKPFPLGEQFLNLLNLGG